MHAEGEPLNPHQRVWGEVPGKDAKATGN